MSGKKPSPINEAIRYIELKIVIGLSTLSFDDFWKKLNVNMPIHAKIPITILLLLSFRLLSLTREQKTPTNITLNKLQLLTITAAGKEASTIA